MTDRSWQHIWMEQCDAAEGIPVRYGLKAAFDYAVGEKLLHFAEAVARHPDFAREMPRFVSRVRSMFTAEEITTHLARIERERREPWSATAPSLRSCAATRLVRRGPPCVRRTDWA